jgi:hypothetical protein
MTTALGCILPLRVSGGVTHAGKSYGAHNRGNMERASLLLASLSQNFLEPAPLDVIMIVRSDEYADVRKEIKKYPGLKITIVVENEIIPAITEMDISGWVKQQALKLAAAEQLGFTFSLVCDADVICCSPFNCYSLINAGRALTQWEPRAVHANWWENSALVLGCESNAKSYGMSVTPQLLARDVVRSLRT